MGFQVPEWEDTEVKEVCAKNVVFWHKPSVITRLDAICDVSHISRSEVLRLLVDLFLNDNAFQERVVRGVKNNV